MVGGSCHMLQDTAALKLTRNVLPAGHCNQGKAHLLEMNMRRICSCYAYGLLTA
jgi:hypothetical protein